MKKLIVYTCIIAALLTLTACGSLLDRFVPDIDPPDEEQEYTTPHPSEHTQYTIAHVPDDGILRLPMRHPLTLNPLLNEDASVAKILSLIFEPLVVFDENLQPADHLAHLELSSDFTRATLAIRHDAIWSDGMPVTSDDLIFSVEVLQVAPEAAIYKRNIDNIYRIDRIDSRTVVIHFNYASMTAAYGLNFPIIPEHYYRGHNNFGSSRNMAPLGNGTFIIEDLSPMLSMTLVGNPYTFRRAVIDRVDVLFIPDAESMLHAFDQGIVDAIRMPFSEWVKHRSVKTAVPADFPAMYFEFIGFNFNGGLFCDVRARQGVAYAFDIDEAVSDVYSHQAIRAVSPIHPSSWMHDDEVHGPAYDIARAMSLLRTVDTYEPLTVLVNEEHIERVIIAERLLAGLVRAGMEAELIVLPFEEYYARLMEGEFDLFLGGMQLDFAPEFGFMFEPSELFGYAPEMAVYLANLGYASTETAFLQAVSQLQQGFNQHLPVISLGFRHSAVLTGTRVQQLHAPATDHNFVFANEWIIATQP